MLCTQAKWVVASTEGNKMFVALLSAWLGQRLLREEGEKENRSRKSSSQVSPGSAPPSAPPCGCSHLALEAKPALPEQQ